MMWLENFPKWSGFLGLDSKVVKVGGERTDPLGSCGLWHSGPGLLTCCGT
ncbi:MAG: hypothetical protein QW201_02835 [Thermoproteota archaeon]